MLLHEPAENASASVLFCSALPPGALAGLLARWGAELVELPAGAPIPGSHFGEPEAGLRGTTVFVRPDTPVHSALHETCHLLCMDEARRSVLDTDAGGTFVEENAVCYLQILLADELPGFGRARAWADMDAWGYTFRLGSAAAWFTSDAEDARFFLLAHGLIDADERPSFRMRR
jgi:hypothetical protein